MKTNTKTTVLRGLNIVGAMVILLGLGAVAANADVCRDQPKVIIQVPAYTLAWNAQHYITVDQGRDHDRDRDRDRHEDGRRDQDRR